MQSSDIVKLANELANGETWAVLAAVAIAGVLGGLARKLTAPPSDVATTRADAVVGGVTALAMLMVVPAQQQLVGLLGLSIVAGFTGKSLLDALRSRAEALLAKEQAKEARNAAADADAKRKEAVKTGLAAVRKANELAAAGDHVTNELTLLTPDLRSSLAKASPRLFLTEGADTHKPTLFAANLKSELDALESELQELM
ncbi:MAG TPA: hypothetical protein VM733_13390 [Thermoanaerobaculia bacterium]|nr:hypothetical protein [Thermoanaerobaculia bacterium]